MHIADEPSPWHVPHDVFHGRESLVCIRFVMHRQDNARQDLHYQDQQCQRAEVVPEIEILWCVVFRKVGLPGRGQGKTFVDRTKRRSLFVTHHASLRSEPTMSRVSLNKSYGGTSRLLGAGTPLNTRPARSNFEP